MRLKTFIPCIAVGVVVLAAPNASFASSIKLSDGTTTLVIADGSVDDDNPATGIVAYDGLLGVWDLDLFGEVIIEDGVEKLYVHDFSASTNSPTATTLTIWFSELNSGIKAPTVDAFIGGLTDGTNVTYTTYKGTSLFDEATLLNSMSFSTKFFSGDDSDPILTDGGDFYLTSKISITHGASIGTKRTSFDAEVSVPDGGMTLSLLGLALVGLAGVRRFVS